MREKIALGLIFIVAMIFLLFGIYYLGTPRIMPYHETYLAIRHEHLPPKVAALLLNAMRVVGVLLIGYGITLGTLAAGPFYRRERWAWFLIVVVYSGTLIPLLGITLHIGFDSPWWLILTLLTMLYIAAALHTPNKNKNLKE